MEEKMQPYLAEMLGKTVKAVLVKQCEIGGLWQVVVKFCSVVSRRMLVSPSHRFSLRRHHFLEYI